MKAESLPARNSVFKIQSLCCRGQPLRVSRGLHSAGPATGASRYRRAAASGSVRVASEVGVVVVDHGSKRSQSNEMLEQFREVFELNTDYSIVESAHMEIAEPTILQAAQKCAERGATSIVIAPYFLSRGRHIQQDIPALVEEARQALPHVTFVIADPIGVDPLLAKLIEKRVAAALLNSVRQG